jgi:hypothetical protein
VDKNLDEDWWVRIDGDKVEQGHYVQPVSYPVYLPKHLEEAKRGGKATLNFRQMPAITATQSCDFVKVKRCVLVRAISIQEAREDGFDDAELELVRSGHRPLFCILAGWDDPRDKEKCVFVDFRTTISLPIDYVTKVAGEMGSRPALRSPYLEYFASMFARCFARVALPLDLPVFEARGESADAEKGREEPDAANDQG